MALPCLRYDTIRQTATGLSPFQAMFGIDAFEGWSEVDLDGAEGEPESLAGRLAALHKRLLIQGRKSRAHGKSAR